MNSHPRRNVSTSLAAFILIAFGADRSPADATVVVVPDDYETIQQAVDVCDTVLVRSGTYPEHLRVGLGETGVRVIRQHPSSSERPRLGRVTVTDGIGRWAPIRMVGLEIEGTTSLDVYRHGQTFDFDACRMDSSIFVFANWGPSVSLRLTRSRVHGGVGSSASPLVEPVVVLDADTLIGGGLFCRGNGQVMITRCVFQGPGSVAAAVGDDGVSGVVSDNRVEGFGVGITVGGDATLITERNVITGCQQGILFEGSSLLARSNEIRACGIGISVSSYIHDGITIADNRVIGSTGNGIHLWRPEASHLDIHRNVVGRSGGHGFVVETVGHGDAPGGSIHGNTSYGNQGSGFVVSHRNEGLGAAVSPRVSNNIAYGNGGYGLEWSSTGVYPETPLAELDHACNSWYANAKGSVVGTPSGPLDLELDPLFCDVDSDSVTLQPGSPLLAPMGCGLIGARGAGCADETEEAIPPSRFGLRAISSVGGARPARVEFDLPHAATIEVEVFDPLGRSAEVLTAGPWPSGRHGIQWPQSGRWASGVYLVRLRFPGGESTVKFFILR